MKYFLLVVPETYVVFKCFPSSLLLLICFLGMWSWFESIQKLLCGLFGRPTRTFDCRLFDADGQGFIRGDTFRVISKNEISCKFFAIFITINIITFLHYDHWCYKNPVTIFSSGHPFGNRRGLHRRRIGRNHGWGNFSHLVHRNHWWNPPFVTL